MARPLQIPLVTVSSVLRRRVRFFGVARQEGLGCS